MTAATKGHPYSDLELSISEQNRRLPRHRWFEFKEAFSEQLIRAAVGSLAPTRHRLTVLDPFAGSGTTLVAAGRMGVGAIGIEVNPFLAFACRAKCAPNGWRESSFLKSIHAILRRASKDVPSPLEGISTFTERQGIEKWLFNRSVLRGYASLQEVLKEAGRYHDPLKLALLGSLMECCNAKRDGKCLRYKTAWQSLGYTSTELRAAFQRKAMMVFQDIHASFFDHRGIQVLHGDARIRLGDLPSRVCDLLVTSPPYLNSFDYSDVYRPELFAGGFVKSNKELQHVRLQTIRSHVQTSWEPSAEIASPLIEPIVRHLKGMSLWDNRLPAMVQSYFSDMSTVLSRSLRVLRTRGQAWLVVATSAYGGIEIPVDSILADIAVRSGWELKGIHTVRQLRAAGQHWGRLSAPSGPPLRESLIILEAPAGARRPRKRPTAVPTASGWPIVRSGKPIAPRTIGSSLGREKLERY